MVDFRYSAIVRVQVCTRRAIHVHCCTLKQALARNSDLSQQLTINSSTESKSKGGLKIEIMNGFTILIVPKIDKITNNGRF